MSEQNPIYNKLEELSKSNFQIVNDEPNIIGWKVKNESGVDIGEVKELLFDPINRVVRYLIVSLDYSVIAKESRLIVIPIGIAELHTSEDEVTIPIIRPEQLGCWPEYNPASFSQQDEISVRGAAGGGSPLNIEHSTEIFDQKTFYDHHHFDLTAFRRRPEALSALLRNKPVSKESDNHPEVTDNDNNKPLGF